MLVRCISNSGRDLPESCREPRAGLDESTKFPLTVGKTYVVYGMTVDLGHIWYYLCDDDYEDPMILWPIAYPSPLFEVVDGQVSRYWEFQLYPAESEYYGPHPILAFPEWVRDKFYYDRLTDGDDNAVAIFRRYKQLIDQEAEESAR